MLYNIQFLRFLAAMLVVLYHAASRMPDNDAVVQGIFRLGEAAGFAGVDIFFVISGFIMALTTTGQTGRTDSFNFARRRLARIFSGYWPFFFLAVLIFSYFRPTHFAEVDLWRSFFLWPQPLNLILLEISWTLSFELYFYLLFTLLILFFNTRNRFRIVALLSVSLLGLNLYQHFVSASFSPENIYYLPFWYQFLTSPFLLEFFAGTMIAWRLAKKPKGPAVSWLTAGSLLFLAGGWINDSMYSGLIEQGYHIVPRVFVFGVPACMILTGLLRLEARGIQAPAHFSELTGGASYAVYLSHILILSLAWNLGINQFMSGWQDDIMIAAYILLMSFIAIFSVLHYTYLEKPLHRLFKRWIGLHTTQG